MKQIVILTRGYYPQMSPVSAVLDKYIQLIKQNYNIYIIATLSKLDAEPLADPHIKIHYISNFVYRLRLRCDERFKNNPNILNKSLIWLFKLRTAICSYFIDDYVTKWEEEASYKAINDINKDQKVDVVISLSGAITHSHFAAKRFKESHPSVRWITFFTDPITYQSADYYPSIFNIEKMRKRRYKNELSIYDSADYNILLEDLYYDALYKFHQPKEKTICFKYVLDDIRKSIPMQSNSVDGCIRLVYAGALYKVIRNPEYMLSIISQIDEVYLDMYVRSIECTDIIKKYISYHINLYPEANTQRYKEMICYEYDVLVNIGNNCKNQSPSKMLELLSSGRPILNFYYNKDSQYEMIEKYPLGLNVGRDDNDAVGKVRDFCKCMKGKQLAFTEVVRLYPENSINKQKDILESLF